MDIPKYSIDKYIENNFFNARERSIKHNYKVHWHEFYELEVILDGDGVYNIDGVNYPIRRGSMFLMNTGSLHHVNFKKQTKVISIMFTSSMCDLNYLISLFFNRSHIYIELTGDEIVFFCSLIRELIAYTKNQENTETLYSTHIVNTILGKICNISKVKSLVNAEVPLQRAIVYIQNNFTKNITLSEVAEVSNYSVNYFSNKFKSYMGTSFKQYVLDLRFSFAQYLLKNTELSVTEICYKCGFNEFTNFMYQFKNKFGVTPKNYRKL